MASRIEGTKLARANLMANEVSAYSILVEVSHFHTHH